MMSTQNVVVDGLIFRDVPTRIFHNNLADGGLRIQLKGAQHSGVLPTTRCWAVLRLDGEPVVRQLYVLRQHLRLPLVEEIMVEMYEKSPLWPQLLYQCQRLLQTQVR